MTESHTLMLEETLQQLQRRNAELERELADARADTARRCHDIVNAFANGEYEAADKARDDGDYESEQDFRDLGNAVRVSAILIEREFGLDADRSKGGAA